MNNLEFTGTRVNKFTNLTKLFWPEEKITKGDLINYYQNVSEYILPYLKDRPVMLHRYPNGIQEEGFYQKNLVEHPPWVKTVKIQHEEREVNYILIQDEASLLYAVNLGSIDFHPFLSTIQQLDKPDYLIFDLDPNEIEFECVIEIALKLHAILEKAKIKNYCKTSGGRGLHIFVPLNHQYTYKEAKAMGEVIAKEVQNHFNDLVTLIKNPGRFKHKVYIDYQRNNLGQTTVSPYSVRPKQGAPVSTPLEWKEVKKGLNPIQFTIKTIPKRVEEKGDIFSPILGKSGVPNGLIK